MERWIECNPIHTGPVFSVWSGKAALDDGALVTREVVRHPGSVAVVPVLDSAVILVRQFRIAIEREILELPAARIEAREEPEQAAHRELREETGYEAREMVPGPIYYSSVGFSDEQLWVFLALGLTKTRESPEADERISLVQMPLAEIEIALKENRLEDSKTIIGLQHFLSYIRLK